MNDSDPEPTSPPRPEAPVAALNYHTPSERPRLHVFQILSGFTSGFVLALLVGFMFAVGGGSGSRGPIAIVLFFLAAGGIVPAIRGWHPRESGKAFIAAFFLGLGIGALLEGVCFAAAG